MTHKDKTPHNDPPPIPDPPAPDPATPGDADAVAALQGELDDLKDRLLRVSADYQNFARRSASNVQTAREQQTMEIAKALLAVVDHFDLALRVDLEKTSAQSLLQGLQIVRDELLSALERFGVRKQEVKAGDEFVPGQHEAVMQQPVEGLPPSHVAAVLQSGYVLNDKPLRPAKVSVSA